MSLCICTGSPEPSLLADVISTVMSPNIAWPLTLRTRPSDYATLNQVKYLLIFDIRMLLEREKQQ